MARDQSFVGSYETGFHELDDNAGAWPIPNALLVVPKAAKVAPKRSGARAKRHRSSSEAAE